MLLSETIFNLEFKFYEHLFKRIMANLRNAAIITVLDSFRSNQLISIVWNALMEKELIICCIFPYELFTYLQSRATICITQYLFGSYRTNYAVRASSKEQIKNTLTNVYMYKNVYYSWNSDSNVMHKLHHRWNRSGKIDWNLSPFSVKNSEIRYRCRKY